MSNHLAVATVTATLQDNLGLAAGVVSGTKVTSTRPDTAVSGANGSPGINIFLYQVMPNAAYRNEDLPTRRADGQLVSRPQAAVILHYLISFFGDDIKLEAHRLLGAVVRQLHAQPALTRQEIQNTIVGKPELATSNLGDQVDLVRFTPLNLSLEEQSKLWSNFFQVPYILSVAYEASAILIETDDIPLTSLKVKYRNVYVLPFRQPQIDSVVSKAGDSEPIFFDSVLLIKGKQLRGDVTLVLLGSSEYTPQSITDTQITLPIPAALQPGVQVLQVIQKQLMGLPLPGLPHTGFESNVATFILLPRITAVTNATLPNPQGGPALPALKINLDLMAGKDQRVFLLLNNTISATPIAYQFLASPRASDSQLLTIATPGMQLGKYFIQVQIDGATSPLELDPANPKYGPTVTIL